MNAEQIVAVGTPSDCQKAREAGFRTMSPAWRAEEDFLTGPSSPFSCDIVCVCGHWEGELAPLANGLTGECRRAGAWGLFLDIRLPADRWVPLAALFPPGLRLFAPFQNVPIESGERITWVSPLPAAGEGFAEAISRLPGTKSVFLPLVRRKTKIPRGGPAEAFPLSGEELRQILTERKPGIYRSSGQMADYFTISSDGQTYFYLFDSRETAEEKLSLLHRNGIGTVFMLWEGLSLLPNQA